MLVRAAVLRALAGSPDLINTGKTQAPDPGLRTSTKTELGPKYYARNLKNQGRETRSPVSGIQKWLAKRLAWNAVPRHAGRGETKPRAARETKSPSPVAKSQGNRPKPSPPVPLPRAKAISLRLGGTEFRAARGTRNSGLCTK